MKRYFGFSIIEMFTVITIVVIAGLFFLQISKQIDQLDRDRSRKTAVNAMHYSLEEVYYPAHSSYPREINSQVLPSVDPSQFTDPNGIIIGAPRSDYTYEGLNCDGTSCRSYVIRSLLERENEFIRESVR